MKVKAEMTTEQMEAGIKKYVEYLNKEYPVEYTFGPCPDHPAHFAIMSRDSFEIKPVVDACGTLEQLIRRIGKTRLRRLLVRLSDFRVVEFIHEGFGIEDHRDGYTYEIRFLKRADCEEAIIVGNRSDDPGAEWIPPSQFVKGIPPDSFESFVIE